MNMHKNIAIPNSSFPMDDLNFWFDLRIKKGIMKKAVEYRVILGCFFYWIDKRRSETLVNFD